MQHDIRAGSPCSDGKPCRAWNVEAGYRVKAVDVADNRLNGTANFQDVKRPVFHPGSARRYFLVPRNRTQSVILPDMVDCRAYCRDVRRFDLCLIGGDWFKGRCQHSHGTADLRTGCLDAVIKAAESNGLCPGRLGLRAEYQCRIVADIPAAGKERGIVHAVLPCTGSDFHCNNLRLRVRLGACFYEKTRVRIVGCRSVHGSRHCWCGRR